MLGILVLLAVSRGLPAGNAAPNNSIPTATISTAVQPLTPGVAVAPPNSIPIPAAPENGAGCFTYIVSEASEGWQSLPCMAASTPDPHQTIGGSSDIEGVSGGPATTYFGQVTVGFSTFSGESDNKYGSNDWSMQANTNQFTGSNSQTDEVQFVEINYPTYLTFFGYAKACVEQVDVTTQNYAQTYCVSTSIRSLSSSFDNYVFGEEYTSGGTNYLEVQYCEVNVQCWTDSTTDYYGLTGSWSAMSGTILGLGSGSTADFTSPTSLTTTVYLNGGTTFSGSFGLIYSTDEMNNLSPGTASSGCSGYICQVATPAT